MTAVPELHFPGSDVLHQLWPQLHSLHPRRAWAARLRLHHVEAAVKLTEKAELSSLQRAALHFLSRGSLQAAGHAAPLLDSAVLGRLLHQMSEVGLVESTADESWHLTPRGERSLDTRTYSREVLRRRSFYFVDRPGGKPPHFLHLFRPVLFPLQPPTDWAFDPWVLQQCNEQPSAWKRMHRFPQEIDEVIVPSNKDSSQQTWETIILDQPMQTLQLLVEAGEGSDFSGKLVGFSVDSSGSSFLVDEPALELEEWNNLIPEGDQEPATTAWRQAWEDWAQQARFLQEELALCRLYLKGAQLEVQVDSSLLDRIQTVARGALQGEVWLQVGSGSIRRIAQLLLRPLELAD